jgi:hypothetical protein
MKNTEDFLREICPNHTDKSKWNKSELLHILDNYQALQLQQTDVSGSAFDEIYAELTRISAALLTKQLSELKEDWNFCKTTPKKDIRKIMNNVSAQNEIQRGLSIKLIRIKDKFREHYC